MSVDRAVLEATFRSRIELAKMTELEAQTQARDEWLRTQGWIRSQSQATGSFLWFCDEFELDPSAVRRAIRERK